MQYDTIIFYYKNKNFFKNRFRRLVAQLQFRFRKEWYDPYNIFIVTVLVSVLKCS